MPVSHKPDCGAALKNNGWVLSLKHWTVLFSFKKNKTNKEICTDFQYRNGKNQSKDYIVTSS